MNTKRRCTPWSEDTICKFWSRVAKGKKNECWLWMGRAGDRGYGQIYIGAYSTGKVRMTTPHKYSMMLYLRTEIPKGLCVLHTCDTPLCVNPKHLFLGTNADNTHDMIRKGRHGGGNLTVGSARTKCEKRKLNESKVIRIRRLHKKGFTYKKLGLLFRVGDDQICRIVNRKCWKHV